MVTGSHIPADRNGIKFYTPTGEILKSDEASIKESVSLQREKIYASTQQMFTAKGALVNIPKLPEEQTEPTATYLERYTNLFPKSAFSGKHVIVYQHSAVGRDLLVTVFEALGEPSLRLTVRIFFYQLTPKMLHQKTSGTLKNSRQTILMLLR